MSQKQSGGDSSSSARGPGLRRSVSLRLLARSVRGRTKSTADLKEQQQPFKRALQSKPTDYFSGLELPGDDSKDFIGGAHHREAGEEQGSDAKAESLLGRLHSTSKKGQKMDLVSTHCAPRFVKRSAYLTDASARSYTVTGYPKSTRSSKRNAAASTSTSAHQTVVTKESAEISDENHHQKKKKQASQQPKLKGFQVRVINTHSGRTVVRAPVLDEPGDGADADAQGASESLPPSAAELKYTAQRALINTTAVLRATTSVANSAAPGGSSAKPDTPAGSAAINVQIGSKSGGAGAGADATRASGPNATATASAVPAQKQRSPPKVQSARATSGRRRQQQQQQQRRQRAKDDSGFQINLQFESEQSVSGSSNGNATGGNGTANGTAAPGVGQMVQGRASTESVLESWGISTPTDTAPAAGAQQGGCRDDSGRTLATSEDDSDVDSAVEDTIRMVEGMSRGYPATIDSVFPGTPGPDHRNSSVILSDESQKLIESIFSGRLSVSSNPPAEYQQVSGSHSPESNTRASTAGGSSSSWRLRALGGGHNTNSSSTKAYPTTAPGPSTPQTASPSVLPPQQLFQQQPQQEHGVPSGPYTGMPTSHTTASKSSAHAPGKLGLSRGQPQTQEQQHQPHSLSSMPTERNGNKMRKPSFWSIFRGGSGRKDQSPSDEKKEAATATAAAAEGGSHHKHHLKRQQSASAGIVDKAGFARMLALADSKTNSPVHTATDTAPRDRHKTLKPSPSFPPPLPRLSQTQAEQTSNMRRTAAAAAPSDSALAAATGAPNSSGEHSASAAADSSTKTAAAADAHADHPAFDSESHTTASASSSVQQQDNARSSVCTDASTSERSMGLDAASATGDSIRDNLATSGYHTPDQEFHAISPAESRQPGYSSVSATLPLARDPSSSAAAHDEASSNGGEYLVQGADSVSTNVPAESLRTLPIGENHPDSDDDDDDSDIIPLAQSMHSASANGTYIQSHCSVGTPPDSPLVRDSAAGQVSAGRSDTNSRGLGIRTGAEASANTDGAAYTATSGAVNDAAAATSLQPLQSTPVSPLGGSVARAVAEVARSDKSGEATADAMLEELMPGGRLRFSPENAAKELPADQQQQQATQDPSSPVPPGPTEDGELTARSKGGEHDNAKQARAMGKYLYDIEDVHCRYSRNKEGGSSKLQEPPIPEILHGISIPSLVNHAEWLGKREIFNGLALRYYIANYDFAGLRIDECLRRLCSHIYLRGESQVIDRLLVALAQRYCDCNPDTKLKTADVAHAVTYSTLLLNTDLHIAQIRTSERMTKSRFVRNTIDTIAQFQSSGATAAASASASSMAAASGDSPLANAGQHEMSTSPPPQLPELDLSKQSIDSSRSRGALSSGTAEPPSAVSSRMPSGGVSNGETFESESVVTNESSGLRGLVASIAPSPSPHGGNPVSRTSRDVVRLMGARGKRFSFFETNSGAGSGNGSGSGPAASMPSSAVATPSGSLVSGAGLSSAHGAGSSVQGVSSPSSLRAFDRLRRKVSTSGAHSRSRSGTMTLDESSLAAHGRPSLSGSSHHSHQRDLDSLGAMVSKAISANPLAHSSSADVMGRAASTMPNLTELSVVLKDVYTGIKNRPLGQPLFARQANVMSQQQYHQAHGGGYGMHRDSHEQLYSGNPRTSVALLHTSKTSLDVDMALQQQHNPFGTYGEYDMCSPVTGRPSSVRSVPLHPVQRSRSITSMNKGVSGGGSNAAQRRPPQHPDLRIGTYATDGGVKRSGTSVINFSTATGMMRMSPSSASMGGGGYGPPTPYTPYMRSPIENQYIRSGVLVRKHLFERTGKKASHRSWRTCYVSVDRGTVAMYKMDSRHGGHPDGRELTDTSLQLGSVSLRHTLTQMMPPPGYSRSRPHVFALQLPSGGVYLFQTASEVELRDWVAACNYWAARESKAPYMIGGVYNMEYGWDNTGDFALRFDEREAREERGEQLSVAEQAAEDQRVLGEKEASKGANILEWTPPNNPMQRSDLDEASQLSALLHHITYLEEELVAHKKVQGSIDERFYPKTQQYQRAFSNWERKAQYILKELIKYQSYADCLQKAIKQMQDDMAAAIPEEASGEGSAAGGAQRSGAAEDDAVDEDDLALGSGAGMHSKLVATPVSAGLSASRASLPRDQQQPLSAGGRRTTDANGNQTTSKSLPIKELLAPASDKARNRASIIGPSSTSSTTTASTANTPASTSAADKLRSGAQQPKATAASNGSSAAPDAGAAAAAAGKTAVP